MTEITEAQATSSRLDVIRKLLAKAEEMSNWLAHPELHPHATEAEIGAAEREVEAMTGRAADLIAKYGIDEAMLTGGNDANKVVDTVIWVVRPFGEQMQDLLRGIAQELGAQVRNVKQHTGSHTKGQLKWQHGLRVFAFGSDLARIELLYTSLRNQALSGASRIKGEHKFGQDQKAHRESYLEGFTCSVVGRISRAEADAKAAAEAEREQEQERALLAGEYKPSASVEMVLADRKSVVRNAMTLALYGKTAAELDARAAENREQWAEMDKRARERWEARKQEQANCARCQQAKSGYCATHRDMKPSQATYRPYQRVGDYFNTGYEDGRNADLGPTRTQVGQNGQRALS
jgi:hypothetical protein